MIAVTFEAAERRPAEAEAGRERECAEELLLNILPKTIAQRLRHGEGLIAGHYTEATVLFADIVDFTRPSANISTQDVIASGMESHGVSGTFLRPAGALAKEDRSLVCHAIVEAFCVMRRPSSSLCCAARRFGAMRITRPGRLANRLPLPFPEDR